jgi:hypothetical protein
MKRLAAVALIAMLATPAARAYPVDGYDHSQIRRLEAARLAQTGEIRGRRLPPGALLPMAAVVPSAQGVAELPPSDPVLAASLRAALGDEAALYSVALLDLSDPEAPRYAGHNDAQVANIGSVGKLLVLYGLLDQLARLYPQDSAARERILRDTQVTVDDWIVHEHHAVPMFEPGTAQVIVRRLRPGDTGNLWEFLDWMMSASANGAGSMVVQQMILLEHFGHDYPAAPAEARAFLDAASARELGALWRSAMARPLVEAGFDLERFRQGSPFTATAKRRVAGIASVGNARDLVRLLNGIERGEFIDAWSSREAKRLLYMTQRRIRYASHPALDDAAVYFKSGSLYSCQPEPDFVCRKYMGNRINRLASIAIVESPADAPAVRYLVAVMSNVLRRNSAVAHQTLALRIHRLVESRHRERLQQDGLRIETRKLPAARIEDAEGGGP